ncbi:hypothetical protein [Agromyces italicus]|uniref:hypothetical protein n=1 Tax=Agromyces italicus TaxID=279572 RepID=UPI0003B3B623|nr:hypothetical protein [Agromyces italicus]
MIDLGTWAKQTPGKRDPRGVLVELDTLQAGAAGMEAETERAVALDTLVRRGVLTEALAGLVRQTPVGASASAVARKTAPAPVAVPARIVEDRPADPGAVVGTALVVAAPIVVVVGVPAGLDLVVASVLSTVLLLLGELVLATTARRGVTTAPRRFGRLSPVALRWIAAIGGITPVVLVVNGFADPAAAAEFLGGFVGLQGMMVLGLLAFSEIARRQDWNARGGRSADPRVERGDPVSFDLGAVSGLVLIGVAPLLAAAGLVMRVAPIASSWAATAALIAGALVLGLTAGRADTLAPSRRGRLSSRVLWWVVGLAVLTPVAQFVVILANLDGAGSAVRICLTAQLIAVVALIVLPSIARTQERGGPLRA